MRLIGLAGKAGAGKSTVAKYLNQFHGFERHRFADPLKAMLKALGLTFEQIDGNEKEVPCDLLRGQTPRYAMQTLGTEWGRETIGDDLWIHHMEARLTQAADLGEDVVIDDVRFHNEVDLIRHFGGQIWKVTRSAVPTITGSGHISEQLVIDPDVVLINDQGIEDLMVLTGSLLHLFYPKK